MPVWNDPGYITYNSRQTTVRSGSDPDRGRLFPGTGRPAARPEPRPQRERKPEERPSPDHLREPVHEPELKREPEPGPEPGKAPGPEPVNAPVREPKGRRRTGTDAAIARLLNAIALEEAAMAHLIQTEMEKAERATRQTAGAYTLDEVLAIHRSAADIIYVIARKEELLVAKLQAVMKIAESLVGQSEGAEE